jgi:hypothetical protein
MDNKEKAKVYDDCLRESDRLQRINSKFKSEYSPNIPPHIQNEINSNNNKIAALVARLESLFK